MPAKPPIPILRSFDEATAKAFYIGFLGFTVDWEHRFAPDLPLYFQVSMQCCILHISEHFGDASPGSHVRIAIDDVVGYCTLYPSDTHPYPIIQTC